LALVGEFRTFSFPGEKEDSGISEIDDDTQETSKNSSDTQIKELPNTGFVLAGAGVLLSTLVQRAAKLGYSGLEFAVGIPGTVGGAIFMNAGTADNWIGKVVSAVTVIRPGNGLVRYEGSELKWQYRSSSLPLGEIVVEVELKLEKEDRGKIRGRMKDLLDKRQETQPISQANAGSIFKNPPGFRAGQLIDFVGLKGYRVGDAVVSDIHANFIVNDGQASAADVIAVIQEIRRRVKENYGLELQTEIRFLGFSS
jgi:UDP-N-acetylmuramate dehydrogenase